jgi:hypothetical protein
LKKKDRFDFLKQAVQFTDDHEKDDNEPQQSHPMGKVFFSHLFENRMNHRHDDSDSGNLEYGDRIYVHDAPHF